MGGDGVLVDMLGGGKGGHEAGHSLSFWCSNPPCEQKPLLFYFFYFLIIHR